jgi:long-chain acyl-CoA synthetase
VALKRSSPLARLGKIAPLGDDGCAGPARHLCASFTWTFIPNRHRGQEMTMTPIQGLHHHAEARPQAVAFIHDKEVWSYGRLAYEVERLACALVGRGLKRGDRVVLHMANLPELVVAYYACFRMGAIAAPLNIRLKSAELAPLMQRLRPALYIGQADLYPEVAAIDTSILAADRRFIVGGPVEYPRVQAWARLFGSCTGELNGADPDANAPAILLGTSGTTGQPKFVIHTPRTLAATVETAEHLAIDGDQIAIHALPMVHASGAFVMLACIRFGVPVVLFERFDADAVLDGIERHRGTWLLGLPFMFVALLERQRMHARNVGSLQTCLTAGDVCPIQLQHEFPFFFGVPLRSFWGATEAGGCLTYGPEPGPVSRIVEGAQVRLVDDRGVPVPRGKVGELVLRGPNVTIGYWAGPGMIEGAPRDGWFRTGDLMRQGEGDDLWFVSRKKDLIVRGGSNISPSEVEHALIAHPAVRDAGVVGVPDAALGQRVAGFVQLENEAQGAGPDAILADVAARLADYKVPESLGILEEIPRNAQGRIDRKLLLTMVSDCAGSGAAAAPDGGFSPDRSNESGHSSWRRERAPLAALPAAPRS